VIRLHAVRHSVADLLASLGVPPVDAAALLGHTTSVYLDTYARATTAGTALAAARLGEALGRLAAES
jgi:integrase